MSFRPYPPSAAVEAAVYGDIIYAPGIERHPGIPGDGAEHSADLGALEPLAPEFPRLQPPDTLGLN